MLGVSPNRVLVYINGVKVDPIAVSVTATRDDLASFSITVPGIPEWDILPARSHVVVFYADEVSSLWRLLVEGEYISYQKTKTAAGARSLVLNCRSMHGVFAVATNATLFGAGYAAQTTGGAVDKQFEMIVNGRRLPPANQVELDMPSPAKLFGKLAATSTTASIFFPQLVRYVLSQLPIEAFYMHERYLVEKMFALMDNDIAKVLDPRRLQITTESNARLYNDDNLTLMEVLRRFESMAMYQHIPVLAPPIYGPASALGEGAKRDGSALTETANRIPELLFTPYLFNVIPPACNVIFQDQIQMLTRSRDFANEPTRVATKLPSAANQSVTKMFMSNAVTESFDVATELIQNYPGVNPGRGATHDMLSGDEMYRGVVCQVVPVNLEQNTKSSRGENETETAGQLATSWDNFWDHTTRHYYHEVVGSYRSADLTCVFLPCLVPGVPCLVEDATGPFHGYVQSVTHVLSNDAPPQTSVRISHVFEAYIKDGVDRTPPLPCWLNSKFLPTGISGAARGASTPQPGASGTWAKLLGKNAADKYGLSAYAAMVPDETIATSTVQSVPANPQVNRSDPKIYAGQQVNMDVLAGKVVPVPRYTADMAYGGMTENTIAESLRKQADANRAMAHYNWRPGVSISQFAAFHQLKTVGSANEIDAFTTGRPPETLFNPATVKTEPHPFFASPIRMRFTGANPVSDDRIKIGRTVYGGYRLEAVDGKLLHPGRQLAMLTIKAGLERHITKS